MNSESSMPQASPNSNKRVPNTIAGSSPEFGNMLAARDQENLVHGHQAAAAAKPLNQGSRQLAPKTPSNKAPKAPFKLPLNDENGTISLGGAMTAGKTLAKGKENLPVGSKLGGLTMKNAFTTPIGPRNRAPLGMKTTNAKAKAFQTPAPAALDLEFNKQVQKSASARKSKPKMSLSEPAKLDILADNFETEAELEERDIEYMPPPAKPLPDDPDDFPELDLSIFKNGGLTRDYRHYFMNRPDDEGLSRTQRQEMERQKATETEDKKIEAMMLRDLESAPMPCLHEPDCEGDECKDMPEIRRKAEEKFKIIMASIESTEVPKRKSSVTSRCPSNTLSRNAAGVLSQPMPRVTSMATKKPAPRSRLPFSQISSRKQAPLPSNPSPMRHTAATVASRNTMGYSKGRVTSASMRTAGVFKDSRDTADGDIPDTSLSPALFIEKYGIPRFGSTMYIRCKHAGCFKEDDGADEKRGAERLEALWREQVEEDFEFTV
ncbi:hypothetical protein MMC18_006606 [Xylographa bjoerkii]|nr:hypothetical protein [Xylographa bjoerkii]